MSSVFVPGKIIISGEHSVVYGEMAIAASISIGVSAEVVKSGGSKKTEIVRKAIEIAGGNSGLHVWIQSNLPIGSGLGSSAATATAVVKTIREYLGKPIDNDELFKLVMECEKIAHGNPSGIDPATVISGGLISFVKGKPIQKMIFKSPIRLLLVNSGRPKETTREMVEFVAQSKNKEEIITKIGELTERVATMLVNGEEVRGLLNDNGLFLEELGVVGKTARSLSQKLRELGASVKITGAGGVVAGSGMLMAMSPNLAKIKRFLDNGNISYIETQIGDR